jgi:Cytidylyltransferase-like
MRVDQQAHVPTDKLACHLPSTHGRREAHATRPCVLVACGSFNPPTIMHLRMCEAARHALEQVRAPLGLVQL